MIDAEQNNFIFIYSLFNLMYQNDFFISVLFYFKEILIYIYILLKSTRN